MPFECLPTNNGILPYADAINNGASPGLVVLTNAAGMERMLIKNGKAVDKSHMVPSLLGGFGGRSFVFAKNSKQQASTKKYLKQLFAGSNLEQVRALLKRVTLQRLQRLQSSAKERKKLVEFNLTAELVDTIGIFALKVFFGEPNIDVEPDTLQIYNDAGTLETMSFSMAFRTVWRQKFSKLGSFVRLFLLDPLTDWCLTPYERRVQHNAQTLKAYLRAKRAKHAEWRAQNPISASSDLILFCDLLQADKKRFEDEELVLEELVTSFFGFSQTTASSVCQTFYQLIKNREAAEGVLDELQRTQVSEEDADKTEDLP